MKVKESNSLILSFDFFKFENDNNTPPTTAAIISIITIVKIILLDFFIKIPHFIFRLLLCTVSSQYYDS